MQKIPLIAVVGPTASGKTKLGIELAKAFDGEVVSADSMQVYKGISIASAAPTKEETEGIPHHLVEFLELGSEFSVADYVNLAKDKIKDIYNRGKMPILVGGTGLYVNSLIDGIEFSSQDNNLEIRNRLEKEMELLGAEEMLRRLSEIDRITASKLHPNNRRRILRALEVYETTGITFSAQNELSRVGSEFDTLIFGVTYQDREKLYERINLRVDNMLSNGLLDEAKTTLDLPIGKGAMQAIGHKELHKFLRGEQTFDEAVETLKMQTRRYAKRQLTWFNRNQDIQWLYQDNEDVTAKAIQIAKGVIKNG
ncbi:MAG: tRNA (adenosine(37)-N6)-dimethylallyltransferase MiaA [Clostridia bacterium]|nr:tRNA (adenosine(37)-N6)-dimethylallyltransferase MiaA [Clostridia bacterium]